MPQTQHTAPGTAGQAPPLQVLGVASEMFPLLKTGGLADVVGALPAALAPLGVAVRTLLPGHPSVLAALPDALALHQWPDWFGGPARLLAAHHAGLDLLVLDAPHLYLRAGNPYLDATGRDWPDNAGALCRPGACRRPHRLGRRGRAAARCAACA